MKRILFIIFLFIFVINCSKKITVKKYLESLPSDKTDLYQTDFVYDELISNIKKFTLKKQYLQGIKEILKYYKIFESDDDKKYIDYYLGVILKNFSTNSNFINFYKKLPDQEKLIFKFNKWRTIKGNYKYYNEHLISALKVKHNYFLSMKAAEIIYPEKLVKVKNYRNMKTNMSVIAYFNNYFPSSIVMFHLSQKKDFFPRRYLKYRKNRLLMKEYVSNFNICRTNINFTKSNNNVMFLKGDFINVRAKPGIFNSLLMDSLEKWEIVYFITAITNSTNSIWYKVSFNNSKTGFISYNNVMFLTNYSKKYLEYFRLAIKYFYNKHYIESANICSKIIFELKNIDSNNSFLYKTLTRSVLLLYNNHKKICKYLTFKNDKYYNYVKKYPEYFIYDDKNKILKPSYILINFLAKKKDIENMMYYFK